MASRGIAVLTRDGAAVAPYAEALAPLGLAVVAMPVTRSELVDPAPLVRAVAGDHDIVIVASARAASALVAAGRPRGRVWAIGPATARVLAAAGIAAEQPADATAAGLARAVLATGATPPRVLVPRAEAGRDEGLELLRAGGAIVDDVIAYRTVARAADDPDLAHGLARLRAGATWCAVFAPSQVTALAALFGSEAPLATLAIQFAAIGRTTADALGQAGIADVAVAATPTPAGLAAAIATLCSGSAPSPG